MFRFDAEKSVHFCDGLRRRDFLHAGSLAFLGLTLRDLEVLKAAGAVQTSRDVNCILLMLVGGPSQLDTWDMKPDAPSEIRGPYHAIPTNVAGIQVSESFRGWRSTQTGTRCCAPCTTPARVSTMSGISTCRPGDFFSSATSSRISAAS